MNLKLVFLLLLVLGLSSALSCGDDGKSEPAGDPLDVYYTELADIGNTFVDALTAQPEGLDLSAPIAQQIDVYETYTRGLSDDISTARDALQDLAAPAEVADAHAALLASVENALTVAQALEQRLGEINSSEELQALSSSPNVADALQQFQTACTALRDLATENDIQTSVRCE